MNCLVALFHTWWDLLHFQSDVVFLPHNEQKYIPGLLETSLNNCSSCNGLLFICAWRWIAAVWTRQSSRVWGWQTKTCAPQRHGTVFTCSDRVLKVESHKPQLTEFLLNLIGWLINGFTMKFLPNSSNVPAAAASKYSLLSQKHTSAMEVVCSAEALAAAWLWKEELDPPAFTNGIPAKEEDVEFAELETLRLGEPSMLSRICRCSR